MAPPVSTNRSVAPGRPARALAILAAVAAIGLTACSDAPEDTATPRFFAVAAAETERGLDAQIHGIVVIEHDCFVLLDEEFATRTVPIWPHGTSRGEDPATLEVPGSGTVQAGDWVEGSGGYRIAAEALEDFPRLATCRLADGDEVAFLQPGLDIVAPTG